MMWKYANDKTNIDGIIRANIVEAMKSFPIEYHGLHMLPKQGLDLVQKDGDEEEVEEIIHGNHWISLLKQAKISDTKEMFEAYEALVAKFVQEELTNLPRGVYHLSQ